MERRAEGDGHDIIDDWYLNLKTVEINNGL